VTFRVVDPPFVPREPSEPNKIALNAMVLVLAAGAGGGVALLLSLLNPIVVDARMLAEATGLPLLGVVTWNKDAARKRRDFWRLAFFSSVSAFLVIAFVAVLVAPTLLEKFA
jgi:hypothetical protein